MGPLATTVLALLYRGDAVDRCRNARPRRNIDQDPRWRIFGKIARMDRVDSREFLHRGAIDVALQHTLQRRSRGLDTELKLLQHKFGLALDRRVDNSPLSGSNGGNPET